jgi:hypothetical protein
MGKFPSNHKQKSQQTHMATGFNKNLSIVGNGLFMHFPDCSLFPWLL